MGSFAMWNLQLQDRKVKYDLQTRLTSKSLQRTVRMNKQERPSESAQYVVRHFCLTFS